MIRFIPHLEVSKVCLLILYWKLEIYIKKKSKSVQHAFKNDHQKQNTRMICH